jgi:hypothetical protein
MKPLGVTETIRLSGIGPDYSQVPEAYMNAKAQLGKDVHSLCAMAGTGKVKLPKTEAGEYARKFCEWVRDSGVKIRRTEFEVRGIHSGIDYIGHADLEFLWNGKLWVADIKTCAALFSSYGVQLSAYAQAMVPMTVEMPSRAVLWLRSGKRAKLVCGPPIVRSIDFQMWRALLISRAWQIGAKL